MSKVPWWMKIGAKIALSRLPVSYSTWRRLSLFKHGSMDDPSSAIDIFANHLRNAGLHSLQGLSVLELGPGDSLASAVIANAYGAREATLVDVGPFARTDLGLYRRLAEVLRARGLDAVQMDGIDEVGSLLEACNATYLTRGLESLRQLPSAHYDYIWSNAVLEHVDRAEFVAVLVELRRLSAVSATSSHRIDLQDHLAESLNNLRFSEQLWESDFFKRSGFYTNRLRLSEVLAAFDTAGFESHVVGAESWPRLPVSRNRLAAPFRTMSEVDLLARWADVRALSSAE